MIANIVLGIQAFVVAYGVYAVIRAQFWHLPYKETQGTPARICGIICLLILPMLLLLRFNPSGWDLPTLSRINILGTAFLAYGAFGVGRAFYRREHGR